MEQRQCLPSDAVSFAADGTHRLRSFIVRGVPSNFSVADLRSFFKAAIEAQSFCWFDVSDRGAPHGEKGEWDIEVVLSLDDLQSRSFVDQYHFQQWVGLDSVFRPSRCVLEEADGEVKATIHDLISKSKFPRGNVGSTEREILHAISQCHLPTSVLKKLGIRTRASQKKRYNSIAMDYTTRLIQNVAPKGDEFETAEEGSEDKNTHREQDEPEDRDQTLSYHNPK